jgi:hypothetical protein
MQKFLITALVATVGAGSGAAAEPVFNRIATFPVVANMPDDMDKSSVTSAEIIAVTADGMRLVYTDSPLKALGMIDISDAAAPQTGAWPTPRPTWKP